MSHFSVGVITKKNPNTKEGLHELESILEPYAEQTENPLYTKFHADDDYDIDKTIGKRGYWSNPNAKWDWYTIGGRWEKLLKSLLGKTANTLQINDLDLSLDHKQYEKAKRYWEVVVEHKPLNADEDESMFFNPYKESYYIKRYGTKKKYATECASFSLFALATFDGKWFEQGTMGWFGMSSTTKKSKNLFDSLLNQQLNQYPQCYLTIVDCHI